MIAILFGLLDLFSLLLLARVILSWLAPALENPFVELIEKSTEPVLKPIRKLVPPTGGFDLSPLIVFLGISLLRRLL